MEPIWEEYLLKGTLRLQISVFPELCWLVNEVADIGDGAFPEISDLTRNFYIRSR